MPRTGYFKFNTLCLALFCCWFLFAPAAVLSTADEATAAAPSHEDGGETAGEHDEGGVPLDFAADLAFWSLVVFVIFFLVLKRYAWGPLSAALNEREAGIRKDIEDAEAARQRAEAMLAEHAAKLDQVQDEVREIIAEARRDAEHTKQDIVSEAQKEAEATKNRAVREIERARDAALKEMFDTLSSRVATATEHVLGRSVNNDDQDRLIDEALAQFSKD